MIANVADKVALVEEPTKRKRGRPAKPTAPKASPKRAKISEKKKSVGRPRKQMNL